MRRGDIDHRGLWTEAARPPELVIISCGPPGRGGGPGYRGKGKGKETDLVSGGFPASMPTSIIHGTLQVEKRGYRRMGESRGEEKGEGGCSGGKAERSVSG